MFWGQWPYVDAVPGSWSVVHPPGVYPHGELTPQMVINVTPMPGPFYIWKGLADVIPYPNAGKPTTQTAIIGPLANLSFYTSDGIGGGFYPPDMSLVRGERCLYTDGVKQLTAATTEAIGLLDLHSVTLPPVVPPDIPAQVQFPPAIEATLADLQIRVRALEAKLDRMLHMLVLRLPGTVDGWLKELVASDLEGVDVYTVAEEGFLVDLTTIPAAAGYRPGPVPLYEVNARALQLGWVAWTETSDEPGWKWARLDMAKTWIVAQEGTIESVELSLMPGVVADLYKLIRHYV